MGRAFIGLRFGVLAALSLTGAFSFGGWLILNHSMKVQAQHAHQVNVAGRQRMLSQRIARLMLLPERKSELESSLRTMARDHRALMKGDPTSGLLGLQDDPALRELYFGSADLDRRVLAFVRGVRAAEGSGMHVRLQEEADLLLADLDRAVSLHEMRSRLHSQGVSRTRFGVLLFLLLILAAEAIFIYLPVIRRAERETARIEKQEDRTRMVLEAVGDALVESDLDGHFGEVCSKDVVTWLGPFEPGQCVPHYIFQEQPLKALKAEAFLEELRSGLFGFPLLKEVFLQDTEFLAPRLMDEEHPRRLRVDARSPDDEKSVLWVIQDITELSETSRSATHGAEVTALLIHALEDRQTFEIFVRECRAIISRLAQMSPGATQEVLGALHTLKANVAGFGFSSLAALCHELEEQVGTGEHRPPIEIQERILRVWDHRMADLEARFLSHGPRPIVIDPDEHQRMVSALAGPLARPEVADELRRWRYPRLRGRLEVLAGQARRVAARLGKSVEVRVDDGGVRLPDDLISEVWPSVIHVVRNAMDHGIEAPSQRERRGKPSSGRLRLAASLEGQELRVVIEDDGGGIDWEALEASARALGLGQSGPDLLFISGLSSRRTVGEFSGRGVGLAEVSRALHGLGGRLDISSETGKGTRFELVLPVDFAAASQTA